MNDREKFETWYSDNGATPHAIEKLPNGEYSYMGASIVWLGFKNGFKACAESKQSELEKANARIAQLEEALTIAKIVMEKRKFGIDTVDEALTNSPDTWLSEHDKAIEIRVLEEFGQKAGFGSSTLLSMIESRK